MGLILVSAGTLYRSAEVVLTSVLSISAKSNHISLFTGKIISSNTVFLCEQQLLNDTEF